jgi:RND family efflux transporter MFP subunit
LAGEEGYPHQGSIDFASNSVSPTTGTLLLRATIPNSSGVLLPGLQARVRVPLEKKEALLVPQTAVGSDQQGTYLLIVNGSNMVERRPVATGMLVDNMRVVEGVRAKEWIVVKGLLKAAPGRPVTPERETSGPSGRKPSGDREAH